MRATSCLLLGFVTTIHLAACSPTPDPPPAFDAGSIGACKLPFVGDPNAPMEMNVVSLGPNEKLMPIEEGSDVTLMYPPQGGRVVFAGVRARNVYPCGVRLSGAMRDPVSKQVRLDNRIINLQVTDDGYGQSDIADISAFANIALCPNQWSEQDLMDAPYELTVSLADVEGRKVTKVIKVIPRCNEPGRIEACLCECDSKYMLGMMCDLLQDGGIEDAPKD